jgi:hypothetical protein
VVEVVIFTINLAKQYFNSMASRARAGSSTSIASRSTSKWRSFRGTSLRPLLPRESKHKDVRYLDIHEDDQIDEQLLASWIRQPSKLPGWMP